MACRHMKKAFLGSPLVIDRKKLDWIHIPALLINAEGMNSAGTTYRTGSLFKMCTRS